MFTAGVLTASDKGAKGERADESGKLIALELEKLGYNVVEKIVVQDEIDEITSALEEMVDRGINLILTTGGTGFSKRDVTPEATKMVIERESPGISEAIRHFSFQITKKAMLSRAVSGIKKDSLIINMPGSPKAVKESMDIIMPSIEHGLEILLGLTGECARK